MEFEDRFKCQLHPVIAAPTSFTPDQVKELTDYAHQYHVDILPLVQGPGHAGFILKHDEFKHHVKWSIESYLWNVSSKILIRNL